MKTHSLHRQAGLNLIEVLVAALILSVGLLSLAGLQVASLKSTVNASNKQQAAQVVHELLERMRSNREAALNGDYNVNTELAATCSGSAPVVCDDTVVCSPAEMAQYDLYTMQCGGNTSAAIDSGINEQLYLGRLTVQCMIEPPALAGPPPPCTNGVTVNLQWKERLGIDGIQGENEQGGAEVVDQEDVNLMVNATI